MILTVYDLDFFPIAQFDNYKDLSKYIGASIDCLQSYISKSHNKENKCIKNKFNNHYVYIRRDYIDDNKGE